MHKVQVKVFSKEPVDAARYVPVFHRFIREHSLGELMIDVAEYSHVTNGPEVVLIGHESDYVLDQGQGRLGLLYCEKRAPVDPQGAFVSALRRALTACVLLEKETSVQPPIAFRSDELLFRIADRLNAPNNDETLKFVQAELVAALERLYAGTRFEFLRVGSERELFSVAVRAPGAPPIADLLERLRS
jgi:hypothetical protein